MSFLQGNLALLLGLVAVVLTLSVRRFAREPAFRRDLSGAAVLYAVYVVLRISGEWASYSMPEQWHPFVRVTWMLAFAFGTVRFSVAIFLAIRRRVFGGQGAKIQRDVVDFALYVVCAVPILKTQLKIDVTTLLGTSAVLSLVLGLALQETLGNLFAGISLQLERPFAVGDFIRVGQDEGRVVQIAWRSTRIETVRKETVTFPNSLVAKGHVVSFSGPAVAIDLTVSASYGAPPNRVKGEVLETLRESPTVLKDPAPWVRVNTLGDSAVVYAVRLFIADYAQAPKARDEVLSRLWYRFARAGIEIPFPQSVVHLKNQGPDKAPPAHELLSRLEWFAPFSPDELLEIANGAHERRYGEGEEIVTEGRDGSTFFVVISGRVGVRGGQPAREVATLARGQAFGEMSLLTGEPRSATVVALEDSTLLELDRAAFARHFSANPERAREIATLVTQRRAELIAANQKDPEAPARESARVFARLKELFRLR